ncbi:MAG TPA: hydroxyisourate hydrolase [Bryobacteraceae bacterium]|nr:hydroxyisourate hydrolase [Bryobacteraceae bacterium]
MVDTSKGAPAARVPVSLVVFITGQGWREVGRGITNNEGRIFDFGEPSAPGVYRLMFDVASYLPERSFLRLP